ncbi:hypothetical protein Tco_1379689, partial [Tanacetum coccineum]
IIMANPIPLGQNANFPEVDPIQPELELTPAAPNPEDDEEEELEEEELKEEEMDVDEDEEMDDPKIINPYEELLPQYADFQMKEQAKVEFSTLKRLANGDQRMNSFDDDLLGLDSALREEIQSRNKMEQLVVELGKQVQEIKESDVRAENKKLNTMINTVEENAKYHRESAEYYRNNLARVSWHHNHLRHWSFEVQGQLPPHMRYRETPYVAPAIPVAHDDPNELYVVARNATTVPAVDDDDSATP